MKVLIVEDEIVAASRLQKLLAQADPEIEVLNVLEGVLETVNFLSRYTPDLVLLDIQLSDGVCFEIFEKIRMDIPVIFVTAYDEYMQKAFKVNSVDYLLKPIQMEDLRSSLEKFRKYNVPAGNSRELEELFLQYTRDLSAYKQRFMVRSGRGYVSINVSEIAYFLFQNKLLYLITTEDRKYVLDYSLDYLEGLLDPMKFIRINRNMIVSHASITRAEPYFNNRMYLALQPPPACDVIVSRKYLPEFRKWMDQ